MIQNSQEDSVVTTEVNGENDPEPAGYIPRQVSLPVPKSWRRSQLVKLRVKIPLPDR